MVKPGPKPFVKQRITISFPADQQKFLAKCARKERLPVAAIVRSAIAQLMAQKNTPK